MLIPFSFWIFPIGVYKVRAPNTLKNLKVTEITQGNTLVLGMLSGGIGVVMVNLLRVLGDYFEVQSPSFVNFIIAFSMLVFVLLLFHYIGRIYHNKIYNVVKLDQLPTVRLRIRPKSTKHSLTVLLYYFLFFLLTLFAFIGFVQLGDVLILIFTGLFMSVFLIANVLIQIKHEIMVEFVSS